MKRKFFAVFLSLCMVMSLLPMTVLAAPEDTGTTSAPTASGTNFFANGTPITITATEPEGGTKAEFDTGFTATGNSAYISWDDNGTTKYVGVSESVSIYGGGDGRTKPVTLPSTSITMTGGTIWNLFGGNYGEEKAETDFCSTVEGNVNISLSGTAVVKNLLHGAGARNTCVKGTITMTFDGVDLSADKTNKLYVNGGSWGNGNEGTRNIESGTMTTDAVANKVVIKAVDSDFYLIGGGGSGSTKVKDADVTLTNCGVNLLYLSGINGEVMDSSIVATNCTIDSFSATNRGFVGTGNVDLNGCTVKKLNTGAAEGCFTSDSGGTDGSGVTGSCVWDLDESTKVETAQLTPLVIKDNGSWQNTYENLTVKKAGDSLVLKVTSFDANAKDESEKQNTFMVPEGSTLTLNNVNTTIADGNTLTNAGTIEMDETSILTVASGATLEQAGTVNGGSVEVEDEGTVTEYVARVGNAGYDSLAEALNAVATNGGTITLLQNATLEADITINNDITIDGQGQFKIDAQPKNSHAITVASNAALTLENVALNITNGDVETGSYGLNVQYGATLTLDNADVTLAGLSNATISSNPNSAGKEPGKFVLTKGSTITAKNIGGNFSNGGTWTVGTGSKVTIDGCDSHGFSASAITVENGATVDIRNIAYRGISINDANGKLEIQSGGVVNVTNVGTADNATTPRDAVYLSKNATNGLQVAEGGTLNVTKGEKGNDRIVLDANAISKSHLNGTIIGSVKLPENSTSCVVTYVSNNTQITTTVVEKGTTIPLLKALPNQGYNHFVGWTDGTNTYKGGSTVTIQGNTTFTAQWSYIPPANPNYKITIGAMENGTVTANPTAAKAGATVTLTPVPDEGYALSTLTVTDRFGDAVRVTENSDGTYTFTMPNGQVTVTATFVQVEEPAPTEPFVDVNEGDWFYDAVVYAYQNELMDGVGGNRFAPNSETTRAQLVTILYRLEGEPAVSGDLPFTDVEAGIWYTDAILWAAQNNIVNGVSDTEFAPGDDLTRQQLVTILYRYAETKGYDVSASADLAGYPDAGQVQTYAQPAMAWAVAENIIRGMEDGTLKPAGNASRAQIATILMRFCEDVAQ